MWPETSDVEVAQRFVASCRGYGVPADDWHKILQLIVERTRWEADRIMSGAERGEASFVALCRDGHAAMWSAASEHVADRQAAWLELAYTQR